MIGALIGFAATTAAALIALAGVLRTGRAPAHLADVQGLTSLVDELQEERDKLRQQLDDCRAEVERVKGAHGAGS